MTKPLPWPAWPKSTPFTEHRTACDRCRDITTICDIGSKLIRDGVATELQATYHDKRIPRCEPST